MVAELVFVSLTIVIRVYCLLYLLKALDVGLGLINCGELCNRKTTGTRLPNLIIIGVFLNE